MNLSLILIIAVYLKELSFFIYSFCLFLERPGQQILYEHGLKAGHLACEHRAADNCLYTFEGGKSQCSFLKSPGPILKPANTRTQQNY